MNIRLKTERDRVVEILMKLSEEDQSILLNYIKTNLMISSSLKDDGYAAEVDFIIGEEYDPNWPADLE
jgi:hypothetical protein